MKTKHLQIDEKNARQLYPTASAEFKTMLEDTFGKEFFSQKITARIKTYEDACHEIGEQPIDAAQLKSQGFTDDEVYYRKLKTITKALNEGWKADYNDGDQKKWFPWFYASSSGFAFYATAYHYSNPDAGNAVRICFKSDELATYAGQQFTELYKGFIL